MWTRSAFGQNPDLIVPRQSNITMTVTVDVHEHGSADEKGIFVDTGVFALGHTGEGENPSSYFLVQV